MQDTGFQFQKSARMVWRRRWVVFFTALLGCVLGWLAVAIIPDKYESMARVYLDTQSMLKPVLKGLAVDNDVRTQVAQTARRTLLSRPNLEKVIRETDLDLKAKSSEDLARMVIKLHEDIEIKGSGRDNIYVISYEHKDPRLAKRVVETLLSIFVETTLGTSRKDTSMTERFLDEQSREYEARLEAAETRLKEFKRKNVGLMPGESGGYFIKLQTAVEQLAQAELEFQEATKRRDELKRQIEGELPLIQGADPVSVSSSASSSTAALDERIQGLQTRMDTLLMQYTEQHPDVIATRRALEDLEQQRALELERQRQSQRLSGQESVNNPVYQELKIALGNAEAEVSAMQVRKVEYQKRVAKLRELIDIIPEVEAKLARLNRDYAIDKKNYEGLISRRESAKISRSAEQSVDSVQFRIIDPPVVPLVPQSPNRPVLISIVFLLSVGGGVMLAWYLSQIKATFDSPGDLRQAMKLPVLGGVSMIFTPGQRRRRRLSSVGFAFSSLSLFVSYGMMMAIHIYDIDSLARFLELVDTTQ